MTKLEIPSIVVHSGASDGMERALRAQRTLSKQEEIDEGDELVTFEECANKTEVPTGNGKLSESIQPSQPSCTPSHNNNNENVNNNNNASNSNSLHRSRSKVKLLVRSHAVREESSPPPEPIEFNDPSSPTTKDLPNGVTPPSSASLRRHKLRREGSSETWDQPPPLSRGGSLREPQYDTANSAELHQFIVETLNRNQKDRMLLLKIESELLALAKDPKRTMHKFGHMSSYQRMLVHRVAAYFSMEHNVDATGVSVIVNTTKATRVPDRRFKDYIREDLLLPEEPRRSILKRDSSSFDETGSFKSGERMLNGESRRSKSFEERTEEYEKAKRRIFNREHSADADVDCLDELGWDPDSSCSCDHPSESRTPNERSVRLLKVESYESGDSLRSNSLRLSAVSKSHSFNGYENQPNTRILTKQDSGSSMSSRISPSSSGYKSQRSDATLSATPSPTATPNLHTQTGQPYTNPDGSIYHYDPSNPPRVPDHSGHLQCPSKPTPPSNQLAGEWLPQTGSYFNPVFPHLFPQPLPPVVYPQPIYPTQYMSDGDKKTIYAVERFGTTYYFPNPPALPPLPRPLYGTVQTYY